MAQDIDERELQQLFSTLNPGSKVLLSTGCGEPQFLSRHFIETIRQNPSKHWGTDLYQIWTLGLLHYTEDRYRDVLRLNTFFIAPSSREAVNKGDADYIPVFLSEIPGLIRKKRIPIDIALVQVSAPASDGTVSLGVSVDIVVEGIRAADIVIAQVNRHMPYVFGDGVLSLDDFDYIIRFDEPILPFPIHSKPEHADQIGRYLNQIVKNGATIQAGYGRLPSFALLGLKDKKDLGVHSELFSPAMAQLMKEGVITNACKSVDTGISVASFCIGNEETYNFIHSNPQVELRTTDRVNHPVRISQHEHIVAINSALEIDLTGQATTESLGKFHFSGIGGITDFVRGAALAPHGKNVLVLQSTTENESVSRIVPYLREGSGVALSRGDTQFVITEYGIAYLHGKNLRDRALELISIAHPKFRDTLFTESKAQGLIPPMVNLQQGGRGVYPEKLRTQRTLKDGLEIVIRPVKLSDESLIKSFFTGLSQKSMEMRFIGVTKGMTREQLLHFINVDYQRSLIFVAYPTEREERSIVALAQCLWDEATNMAEIAIAVSDSYQNRGIATELLRYMTFIAKDRGLLGLYATVSGENHPIMHLLKKSGYSFHKTISEGVLEVIIRFDEQSSSIPKIKE